MRLLHFAVLAATLVACKKSPMGRVEAIRDELVGSAPHFDDSIAPCAADGCGPAVAASIGGKYDEKKPDQITAAAVAVVVARDARGSALGAPDEWIGAMRRSKGAGADALRLGTALAMSRVAEKHAHAIDSDEDARAFLTDAAGAIPGACKTYASLGAGASPDAMPPVDSPDHSACVQRDLARKEGPGAGYGTGLFRGVAGALALWKHALAALHEGAALTSGSARSTLDARLASLDAATSKIAPKTVAAPAGNSWSQTKDQHEGPLNPKK